MTKHAIPKSSSGHRASATFEEMRNAVHSEKGAAARLLGKGKGKGYRGKGYFGKGYHGPGKNVALFTRVPPHKKLTAGEHITENDMIRMARRAGVLRISQCVYEVIRKQMTEFVTDVVRDSMSYMESALDDQHKAEEFDEAGYMVMNEETDAPILKKEAPKYGGTVGIRHVNAALSRNGFKMYWHKKAR